MLRPQEGVTDNLIGSEVPRLFTPPARDLTPETTRGYEAIAFAEDVLGLELMPWQRWTLLHGLELAVDNTFRFRTLLTTTGRQSGKSTLLQVWALWRMFVDGVPLTLGSAQNLALAEETWTGAHVYNEQVVNPDGSITVNAGHQYLLGPIAVGDLILGQVVCGVTVPPQPASDLVVDDITDTPDPVPPGGTVTYSVPVTNHGSDDASGITLFSSVSRGASITGGTTDDGGTCTVVRGRTTGLSCDLGALASGESETVTITVTPHRPGTITFTSSVSAAGTDDANPSDNTATEQTAVVLT